MKIVRKRPVLALLAGPRGKIKRFLYVSTCSEVLVGTYLVLIKRNRSTRLAFFSRSQFIFVLVPDETRASVCFSCVRMIHGHGETLSAERWGSFFFIYIYFF